MRTHPFIMTVLLFGIATPAIAEDPNSDASLFDRVTTQIDKQEQQGNVQPPEPPSQITYPGLGTGPGGGNAPGGANDKTLQEGK